MKAHYYLSQAQLAIGEFEGALEHALAAHKLCAATNDKSLAAVTAIVLRCKKERWDHQEKRRVREAQDLERQVLDLLRRDRDETLMAVGDDVVERRTVEEESELKLSLLTGIFEKARAESEKRREVPEWVIDDISFGVMVDPVIVSYPPPFSPYFVSFFTTDTSIVQCKRSSLLTDEFGRQKRASHTNGPPSWSTSVDTPATL